jgi:hypothetical protein
MLCRTGWVKQVSSLVFQFHSHLTVKKLADYDCELESDNSNQLARFSDFLADNNPGFSSAAGHFTQVSSQHFDIDLFWVRSDPPSSEILRWSGRAQRRLLAP